MKLIPWSKIVLIRRRLSNVTNIHRAAFVNMGAIHQCILSLMVLFLCHVESNLAISICSPENRETANGLEGCLQAIRDTMVDDGAFWFGTDYAEKCPVPEYTLECQNLDPTPASMADRIFTKGTFDASTIDTFMEVTMHEKPGTYYGCGHTYTSDVEADHPLDPIEQIPLTPWQASKSFSTSAPDLEDTDAQFTIIIHDPGHFILHGVYINVPGDTLNVDDGEVIDAYSGPLYSKYDPPDPYIFMLFRQEQSNMELTTFWKDYFLNPSFNNIFNNSKFISDQNLEGPIAVNFLMSITDAYAAEKSSLWSNTCPMFVEEAERELDLYHVPNDVPFTVSVNIDYFSVGMDFSTCCNDYSYENATYSLDPIGDGIVSPFDNKDSPMTIKLIKMKLSPTPDDFRGDMLTLLMIDPDINDPLVGTTERPLAHWLITNIPNGVINQGDIILSYRGSMLPSGKTHRYQYLLYQQNDTIDINPLNYTPDCKNEGIPDRCLFEVERFVSENNLMFLGATWYVATSDAYIAYMKQLQGEPEEEVCALIPGYDNPCLSSGTINFKTSISLVSIITTLAYVFINCN